MSRFVQFYVTVDSAASRARRPGGRCGRPRFGRRASMRNAASSDRSTSMPPELLVRCHAPLYPNRTASGTRPQRRPRTAPTRIAREPGRASMSPSTAKVPTQPASTVSVVGDVRDACPTRPGPRCDRTRDAVLSAVARPGAPADAGVRRNDDLVADADLSYAERIPGGRCRGRRPVSSIGGSDSMARTRSATTVTPSGVRRSA